MKFKKNEVLYKKRHLAIIISWQVNKFELYKNTFQSKLRLKYFMG